MAANDPLRQYLRVQTAADKELSRVLERAARDARAQIRRLPKGTIRRAQLERVLRQVKRAQAIMWQTDVLGVVTSGRQEAVQAAQEAADALTRDLWRRMPERQAETLDRAFRVSAGEGVGTRRQQRELSTRVVGSGRLAQRRVDQIIQSALVRQLNADELAREVYQHISPTVPGGASYAAMRIARTEINNAFHQQQIEQGQRPGVEAIEWNLSGSHKVPDECNVYAKKREFPPDQVPDKPHPQCLCYLTYKMATVDDFLAALESGAFDEQLGVQTSPLPPVKKAVPRKRTPAKKAAPAKKTAPPAKKATKKAAPPASPTRSPRVSGRDMMAELEREVDQIFQDADRHPSALDGLLTEIARRQGWQARPRVTDRAGVQAAIDAGAVQVFRGVDDFRGTRSNPGRTQREILDELRGEGDLVMGLGLYGNGAYFSESDITSLFYATMRAMTQREFDRIMNDDPSQIRNNEHAKSGTIRGAINPDARTIDYDDLVQQQQEWSRQYSERNAAILQDSSHPRHGQVVEFRNLMSDTGRYAAALGIDVIIVRNKDDGVGADTQHIVLNRTVLILEDQP